MTLRAAVAFLLACNLGCGSTGDASLTASIENPVLALGSASTLSASFTGGLTLHLSLGRYAPGPTDVDPSAGNFQLVKASDGAPFFVLRLQSSVPSPYHLSPGAESRVAFVIGDPMAATPGQVVTLEQRDAVCVARSLRYTGTVTDTASGHPTSVESDAFDVTGCPTP